MSPSTDLEDLKAEIDGYIIELTSQIKILEDNDYDTTKEMYNDTCKKISYVNSRVKTMEMDLQSLRNRKLARYYRPFIRQYQSKLKEFNKAIKWTKKTSTSLNDGEIDEWSIDQMKDNDIMNDEDKAIHYGCHLLHETDKAADRVIVELATIQKIAVETAEKVAQQSKQLETTVNKLDDANEEIRRSKKVLRRMARRTLGDKYIWMCIILIIIAITAAMIIKFNPQIRKKAKEITQQTDIVNNLPF